MRGMDHDAINERCHAPPCVLTILAATFLERRGAFRRVLTSLRAILVGEIWAAGAKSGTIRKCRRLEQHSVQTDEDAVNRGQGGDMKLVTQLGLAVFLLGHVSIASAQGQIYDDWAVGVKDDGTAVFAMTANQSGSAMGQFCFFSQQVCEYRILSDKQCKEGNKYPGLLNSDKGATALTLTCGASVGDGRYVLAIEPFGPIDEAVRHGSHLGMVIPLTGDQFHVMRFSLRGSAAANTFMRGAFARGTNRGTGAVRPARDSTL